jgi:hypothetical protein
MLACAREGDFVHQLACLAPFASGFVLFSHLSLALAAFNLCANTRRQA